MNKRPFRLTAFILLAALLVFPLSPALAARSKDGVHTAVVGAGIANDFLSIDVDEDAHFTSGATIGGDAGGGYSIAYGWPGNPWSSYTTIMVDGNPYEYGYEDSFGVGVPGQELQPPTDIPGELTNETVWRYGDLQVVQTLQIVTGLATGREDTGRYTYRVTNTGSEAHDVGVRVMVDTQLNGNDGAPFRVPGVGNVTQETDFTGAAVPQYWQAFQDLNNPDILAQGTLIGGGVTTPDRFLVAEWGELSDSPWDYQVDPEVDITDDSAFAVYWNPVTLAPGETREFVTDYGLGTLSGSSTLSVTGPATLGVEGNQWAPNPFAISAYVANNSGTPLTDVPVTLNLQPDGLQPASVGVPPTGSGLELAPGEQATKVIPSLAAGEVTTVSWQVLATAAGQWDYTVGAQGETVTRSVLVPALAENNADLADLTVYGSAVPGFDPNTFSYDLELPADWAELPEVVATAADPNATVVVNQAATLPGTATVVVTAADGVTQNTYTVNFALAANDDASLSELIVNGEPLSSFAPGTLTYNLGLPVGTPSIPVVAATAADPNATVVVTQAAALPGTATVVVTAADGVSQNTYTINFTVVTPESHLPETGGPLLPLVFSGLGISLSGLLLRRYSRS